VSDLVDYCATTASWTSGKCAEVRVGDHVTRYVRRGSGSPVILLGASVNSGSIWPSLVEALAARHRLVIPETPSSESDVAAWLRSFMEGIGVSSVAVVAGRKNREAALALTSADEFTIRKLVLVPDGESGGGDAAFIDGDPSASDADRILLVPRNGQPGEMIERIERFISGETPGS
jgi:hypothetical protein